MLWPPLELCAKRRSEFRKIGLQNVFRHYTCCLQMLAWQFKFNFAYDDNGGSSSFTWYNVIGQVNMNRYKFITEQIKKNIKILFSWFDVNGWKESDKILGPCFKVYCKLVEDCVTTESIYKTLRYAWPWRQPRISVQMCRRAKRVLILDNHWFLPDLLIFPPSNSHVCCRIL